MPDWSYRTLFRPLLFRLPAKAARGITLHAMGGLSKIPGGSLLIRTLGHMEVSPLLKQERHGVTFTYPVGLSGGVDPHGAAHRALAQFGFGFVEIGPVTVQPIVSEKPVLRNIKQEALIYPILYANDGLDAIVQRTRGKLGHQLPVFFRIRHMPGTTSPPAALEEIKHLIQDLEPVAAGFYLDIVDEHLDSTGSETLSYIVQSITAARETAPRKPVFLYVPLDMDNERLLTLTEELDRNNAEVDGIVIGDAVRTDRGYEIGRNGITGTIGKLQRLKQLHGNRLSLIVTGGIHEPEDALSCIDEGADFVQLHSGLVYSGPGLPKRINEAILYRIIKDAETPVPLSFWSGWGWMCLLGIGMIIGGIMAWIIAATSVVLPYDIAFLCESPEEINGINERLLPFMSHDRVTLAGTMISIGIIYTQLGRYGLRRRLHWARTALMTSGVFGFSSFLLYLGYGYFDPLHAAAAAILLPMFILAMRDRTDWPLREPPNTRNDRVWRMAQRGQFMMVALGFALAVGGIVISYIGVTDVFVPEDLSFLMTSPAVLDAANGNLLSLIAHDRAGFGGALLSDAIALLATALWGIQQGQRWIWWTFLAGGLPAFIAGFSVHFHIGYTDLWHLSPAVFALLLYVLGLIWLYPYLMRSPAAMHRTRAA